MIPPDVIEDLIRREDAGGTGGKLFEELHLSLRQNDWLFVRQKDARLSVQSKAADSYAALGFGGQAKVALSAAKVRMKTGQQDGDGSFLDDVVVGSGIKRGSLI